MVVGLLYGNVMMAWTDASFVVCMSIYFMLFGLACCQIGFTACLFGIWLAESLAWSLFMLHCYGCIWSWCCFLHNCRSVVASLQQVSCFMTLQVALVSWHVDAAGLQACNSTW